MKANIFWLSISLLFLISLSGFAQGKLLLVGGGSENYNDWSNIPYQWAVNQSANKKVALISYSSESSWLPNYFISLGAVAAKNFMINSVTIANQQATYDSLMAYDVIFFRGGDQSVYYTTYRNTKVTQAVAAKFNAGGVIGGTSAGLVILSEVIFTAQNGSAYPDDCLMNIFHNSIVLKNDFLSIAPGFLFDSHFVERGRLARLLAFLARWKNDFNQQLIGIGVDDMTAFCMDFTNSSAITGTAWGTAAVNIYCNGELGHTQNKLKVHNARIIQLLHGRSINFSNLEVTGYTQSHPVPVQTENGQYTLLLSGSDPVNENQQFIKHFVDSIGFTSDKILIVTGASTSLANSYKQALFTAGATQVEIAQALPGNIFSTEIQNQINQAQKFLFVDNAYFTLYDFLMAGIGNGQLLNNRIRSANAKVGFIGGNSRFAGASVVSDNYITNASASFNGQLTFHQGLNLLVSVAIMPNTYMYTTSYYENTISGLPYALITHNVYRGLWLTVGNFMKYYQAGNEKLITVYGIAPGMMLTRDNLYYSFNDGLFRNRQVGGFPDVTFRTVLFPEKVQVGSTGSGINIKQPETLRAWFDLVTGNVYVDMESLPDCSVQVAVIDISGRILKRFAYDGFQDNPILALPFSGLANGLYTLLIDYRSEQFVARVSVVR